MKLLIYITKTRNNSIFSTNYDELWICDKLFNYLSVYTSHLDFCLDI